MTLSLDVTTLGVPEVQAAHAFYTAALASSSDSSGGRASLDMGGSGRFGLESGADLAAHTGSKPNGSGFRGYLITYIVDQPSDVKKLADGAAEAGAEVLRSPKKALFGSFAAVLGSPDGSIWKLAAATNKDTGTASGSPRPSETTVILGVAAPKTSKAFYSALGMAVDRDYGSKYVDFEPRPGASRLCLMERGVLARDAGVDKNGEGFRSIVLDHRAGSRGGVDDLLAAAVSAGGEVVVAPVEAEGGTYTGYFADPDGFLWRASS